MIGHQAGCPWSQRKLADELAAQLEAELAAELAVKVAVELVNRRFAQCPEFCRVLQSFQRCLHSFAELAVEFIQWQSNWQPSWHPCW